MRQANQTVRTPSLIGADLVVQGTIVSDGDIQIDGRVEGNVRARSVVVGEKASVDGELVADTLTIRGHASGIIQARSTHLSAGARVEGELLHDILTVEHGAHVDANVRHVPKAAMRDVEPAPASSSDAAVGLGLLATWSAQKIT